MTEEKTKQKKHKGVSWSLFKMASERKRLGLLTVLEQRVEELIGLGSSLMSGFDPDLCEWTPGFILQLIHKTDENFIKNNLDCDDLFLV